MAREWRAAPTNTARQINAGIFLAIFVARKVTKVRVIGRDAGLPQVIARWVFLRIAMDAFSGRAFWPPRAVGKWYAFEHWFIPFKTKCSGFDQNMFIKYLEGKAEC